jgi:predicted dehydrogenase/nucleoside-diphosphate-sugar epimerase
MTEAISRVSEKTSGGSPNTRGPSSKSIRAAIVGTGYIAEFHARAIRTLPGVELVSVCDTNFRSARSFAAEWGEPSVFDTLPSMLAGQRVDAVHVLTPPDSHHLLATTALEAGSNVFLEKPMCTSVEEADEILRIARGKGLRLGVNHNFLFSGAYQMLRQAIRSGLLGPLDYVSFNYFYELAQIRLGPFNSWMLRAPENPFLEVGAHLVSAALDLVGPPDHLSVTADRKIALPNGAQVYRRWRLQLTVGRTDVEINVNLAPGFSQRTIYARGILGSASLDFDANTCIVDRHTPLGADFDRYRRSVSLARQLQSQARTTLADYILSRVKLRKRGNPYQISIFDSVAAFYAGLRAREALDSRINGDFGRQIVECCGTIVRSGNIEPNTVSESSPRSNFKAHPTVLVIGGAGFIGRELVRQLLQGGHSVRTMTRGSGAVLEGLDGDRLEIVSGDSRSETDLAGAMQGIEFVYDLATSETKTWDASVRNIVDPARLVGKACVAAKVRRLFYTGTIDSYYAGAKAGTITEETPLDRNIGRRNYYARAKAAAESELMDLHRTEGLPVVIFRPGIVIGRGGIPFHWGVGRFSESVCEVWGDGNNKLPFVLVTDVAAALVRGIEAPSVEGHSYNLIDLPLLSARDYLQELQRMAGLALTVYYRPIWRFYVFDLAKWTVKLAVGHPDRYRVPSYGDWESRTQKAIFDCTRARTELGWRPASDRRRMIDEGIGGSLQSWLEAIK